MSFEQSGLPQQNKTEVNHLGESVKGWAEVAEEAGVQIDVGALVTKLEAEADDSPLMEELGKLAEERLETSDPKVKKALSIKIAGRLQKEGLI
jgi:uncharacterized protein YqgV (UPF0045/DUF77 family)